MKDQKKKLTPPSELDIALTEVLARLRQTNPKEIADAFAKNKERADNIRNSSEERFEKLKRATKGPRKRFR